MPLPGVRLASMNSMSPPTGVHASPVATPGRLVRIATSFSNRARPEDGRQVAGIDDDARRRALGDLHRRAAEHAADLALEIAHAGLARVVADDRADRGVGELGLLGRQAVGLELPLDQVALARSRAFSASV